MTMNVCCCLSHVNANEFWPSFHCKNPFAKGKSNLTTNPELEWLNHGSSTHLFVCGENGPWNDSPLGTGVALWPIFCPLLLSEVSQQPFHPILLIKTVTQVHPDLRINVTNRSILGIKYKLTQSPLEYTVYLALLWWHFIFTSAEIGFNHSSTSNCNESTVSNLIVLRYYCAIFSHLLNCFIIAISLGVVWVKYFYY